VTARTRYQAQEPYADRAGVKTFRGVDPVTGLPVLIYRFTGSAGRELLRLDSEFIPRPLGWRDDGDEGVLVVAWSSAYVPLEGPLDNAQLLEAARALAAAAAGGVTHGDLRPERFLQAGDSLVIEGFGVPWHGPDGSPEADVPAWIRSVRELGHAGSPGVEELFSTLLEDETADAVRLHARLTDVLLRSAPAAPAAAEDNAGTAVPEDGPGQSPEPAAPGPESADGSGATGREQGHFVPRSTFASENFSAARPAPDGPEPAAAPEPAAGRPPERRYRRIVMIAVLAVLGIVLAVLLRIPDSGAAAPKPAAASRDITYVIEVLVEPGDLPPVNLYVVESPAQSNLLPGSVRGTAPRRIALDPGDWVFEGRFQGRVSEPVSIRIPEDRLSSVTIRIPPAGEPAAD